MQKLEDINDNETIVSMSNTLARAFLDDPVESYILGYDIHDKSDKKLNKLTSYFDIIIRANQHTGGLNIYSHSRNNEGQCVALWILPKQNFLSDLFSSGILNLLKLDFMIIFKVLEYMWKSTRCEMNILKTLNVDSPYILFLIGTDPEVRRKGLFSFLINPILEKADNESKYVYLESSKKSNLEIYKKYGFELFSTFYIGGFFAKSIPVYALLRRPQ
jgi:GNAT superfamily N-acetyltransferase